MTDPYSVLGIRPDADEETIKKAYRQKCKQYHPDLHPDDPAAEEKFKEVQAAYSEVLRRKNGGGSQQSYGYSSGPQSRQGGASYGSDPFGFGYGPFGFGFYGAGGPNRGYGRQTYTTGGESPEMQAAANYLRNGYYQEAMNTLNGIAASQRNAQWHYYCALANEGLGNNLRAQEEARTAVQMEPGNYTYQNLLDRLRSPGQSYTRYQQPYAQPSGAPGRFCLSMWMYMLLCNLLSMCCCGGRGGFFCC